MTQVCVAAGSSAMAAGTATVQPLQAGLSSGAAAAQAAAVAVPAAVFTAAAAQVAAGHQHAALRDTDAVDGGFAGMVPLMLIGSYGMLPLLSPKRSDFNIKSDSCAFCQGRNVDCAGKQTPR